VLDRIGGLDERFGPGNFEDDDLCLRTLACGYGMRIVPDAFVHHESGRTFTTAGVDHARAMLRNWAVFKELWGIPAGQSLETGYEIEPHMVAGSARYVPLPALGASHASPDGRVFRVDPARVALRRGLAAVSANEATALREAFAEVAEWADVHRRYQARRRLVQAVFDGGRHDAALLATAAAGLVDTLEENALEPVLLNEGVSLRPRRRQDGESSSKARRPTLRPLHRRQHRVGALAGPGAVATDRRPSPRASPRVPAGCPPRGPDRAAICSA
jgi:hypothetical protein